ncbi:InlB B-repeat-containing protein [Bifidobacterium sp. SO1]|uniref:InlB B-repeat-containing protein n=1 Tax=Bifidobacterium sp. SO1 TaxID=2809029 RepID=UPI001BDBBC01|nr:InlB B-repeat-containing protein [Bifidobacterium sp. SO1]MBT1162965.1 InlB B-repeat-containing protein [Bifidobacterium sp. SO1]
MGQNNAIKKAAALSIGAVMLATGLGLQPAAMTAAYADATSTTATTAAAYDIVTIGSAKVVKFRNTDDSQDIKATIDGTAQDGVIPNYWQLVTRIGLKIHVNKALKAGDVAYVQFNTTETSRFRSFTLVQSQQTVNAADGTPLFNMAFNKSRQRLEFTATDAGAKLATADFTVDLKFNCWPPTSGGGSDSEKDTHTEWTIGSSKITFDNTPLTKRIGYDARYVNNNGANEKRAGVSAAFETGGLINTAVNDTAGTRSWQAQADKKRVFLMKITPKSAPIAKLYVSAIASSMRIAYDATHTSNGDATGQISEAAKEITVGSADAINTVDKAATLLKKNEYAVYHDADGVWWFACNVGSSSEDTTTLANLKDEATTTLYQKSKSLGLGAQIRTMYAYMEFSNSQTPQSATVEWSNSYGQSGTLNMKNTILSNETADGVKLGWIGFEPNGGVGTMDTRSGGVNSKLTLPDSAFTRTGYSFTGWNTQKDGKGTSYAVGSQLQYTETGVTLYAQWKGLPATVTPNANGGSGTAAKLTGVTGQTVKTPAASAFTRTGYTLSSWNTKADGSGKSYAPNTDMPLPAGDTSLYAQWTANTATVTYNANQGSGSMTATNGKTDQTVTLATNAFTRNGYSFTGWNTKPDGNGTAYAAGASVKLPAGGITLYAQWKAGQATITYNANQGTGTTPATTGTVASKATLAANKFTRSGYSFKEWNTQADGAGTSYQAGAQVAMPVGGMSLYAIWTANASNITYQANGGTGTTTATSGKTDQTVKVAANAFTRNGYTFKNWNTKVDGTGTAYAAGADVKLPADGITLYAQWTANAASITYDANGGIGSTAKTTGITDQAVKAAANAFTRNGYSFTGWNTKTDGSGTAYAAGATVKLPAGGVTLYAQWKAGQATISYNANNGTGTTPATTGSVDEKSTLAINKFTRNGYTFKNWNTKADGTGTSYAAGAQITMPVGGLTLYAQWTANASSITYDANQGAGTTAKTTGVTGQTVKTATSAFTRTGYLFAGWNTKADGTGTSYAANADLTLPANGLTLYAQWKAGKSTLSFNGNGGTGKMTDVQGTTGVNSSIPTNGFTRTGYSFTGWNTKADGTGAAYEAGASVKMPAAGLTLYAQWKANAAAITYQANGGAGTTPTTSGTTDVNVKTAANKFTRAGYTFTGWNTKADGSGTAYAANADVKLPAGGITLYAQWTANNVNITYQPNSGAGTMEKTSGVTDQTVKVAANTFTRTGYSFTGWNTKADGTGTTYTIGSEVKLPSTGINLYAQWKANPAMISYNGNMGSGSMPQTSGVTDGFVKAAANKFSRSGYEFSGWNTKADGTGTMIQPDTEVKLPANGITLYAQWKAKPATVSFDANTGAGTITPIASATDQTITIPASDGMTRSGYTFTGWNDKKDGTGIMYTANSTLKVPADGLTLYAQWTANTASLTWNANGGTGTMENITGKAGETITAPDNTFTRDGWTFQGWSISKEGNPLIKPGEKITLTGLPVTMYAIWQARSMTVHYESNGKNVNSAIEDQTFSDNQPGKITADVLSREGYTFTGWNTQADGKGVNYTADSVIESQPGKTITLYAQWAANKASIVFDKNAQNATGSMTALDGVTDEQTTIPANGYSRDGYEFDSWNTKADGTGDSYKPGDQLTLNGNVTLFAQWKQKPTNPLENAADTLSNTGSSIMGVLSTLLLTAGAGLALMFRRTKKERKH